ncbi:TPA: hypothetical protein MCP53_002799 [Klebsiella pneumoniae]|nr:hypothetical protein [Klebsiella pneumoniae]
MAVINSLRALKGVTAPEELKKGDGFTISPQLLLEEEGFNTRGAFCENYYERPDIKAGIRVLADAYKRGDYVPPIIVKVIDGKVYVREGHRRRRAILLAIEEGADIQFVQVVEHKGDEAEQSLLIATSNDGLPLSPTLTLSREDVDAFQELKAKLAELEPKTDESNEDQQELDLAGNQ